MRERPDPDQQRRKLFRRMEWTLVYAPPLLALFVAVFGGLLLAFVIPIEGTTLLGRWALAVLVIFVLPALVYVVRAFLMKNEDSSYETGDSANGSPGDP